VSCLKETRCHILSCSHQRPYRSCQVIAAARDAAKIPPSLSEAKAHTLDPSAPEADVKRAAKEALKIYGRIDVLVNNAGYGQLGAVEDLRLVFYLFFGPSERILSL
jgi:NAD(P)-dependent dehydrogenase (short-subunit alcohol dehydrogenase family)